MRIRGRRGGVHISIAQQESVEQVKQQLEASAAALKGDCYFEVDGRLAWDVVAVAAEVITAAGGRLAGFQSVEGDVVTGASPVGSKAVASKAITHKPVPTESQRIDSSADKVSASTSANSVSSNVDNQQAAMMETPMQTPMPSSIPLAQTKKSSVAKPETKIITRSVRNGGRIESSGTTIILGDVNPGAEIISEGDVVVIGKLRGLVHAGSSGHENAIVWAQEFGSPIVRIASYFCDDKAMFDAIPEAGIAYIDNGTIQLKEFSSPKQNNI